MPKLVKKSIVKKPVAKKPSAPTFSVGDAVNYTDEANNIDGIIISIEGKVATVEDEDENQYDVPLKGLTAREVDDEAEAEEEETEEEEEEVEEEKPAKKGKKKVVEEEEEEEAEEEEVEEEEEEEKPKKKKKGGKGKGSSFAALFNNAEKAERGGGFPTGDHQGLLTDAGVIQNDRGISVWMEFTGSSEEVIGKVAKKTSFLTDEGEPTTGLEYFKTDMATMGYDDLELEGDTDEEAVENLEEHLKKLVKDQPWLDLKVVPQKNNAAYTNIYIQGLCEDQDEKPDADDLVAED